LLIENRAYRRCISKTLKNVALVVDILFRSENKRQALRGFVVSRRTLEHLHSITAHYANDASLMKGYQLMQ
jgi:hypothetical protein